MLRHLRAHLIQHALDLVVRHYALAASVELGEGAHDGRILHERGDAAQKVILRAPLRGERLLQLHGPRLLVRVAARHRERAHPRMQRRWRGGRRGCHRRGAARRRRRIGAGAVLVIPSTLADKRRHEPP